MQRRGQPKTMPESRVGPAPGQKQVLIVGAGAAGTAAAYSLGKHQDRFHVEIWEKRSVPGGVACSETVAEQWETFVNYGVQGGTPTYRNTVNLMNEYGLKTHPVHMMISFGKNETAWTNYSKTKLTEKLRSEIARFEGTLKIINKFEAVFIFLPIAKVLRMFGYSDDFMNQMVFPLTALFFGTGNQTPNVSAAIMARVFLDDDLRLFDYDTELLLSQSPEMFAFPNLEKMYETILSESGAKFYRGRGVKKVVRDSGLVHVEDETGLVTVFDEIIFACDAETALRVLEKPSYMERKALGNVRYYNDLILTHTDEDYMNSHYELHLEKDQYLVRTDPEQPQKIEMSFDLSNYQPQLQADSKQHIFQTIFLDEECADIWTIDEIKKDKVLLQHWWRQFSHSWQHFAFTVPLMRYIQGKQNTWYCGSYTLVNTHEVAVMSGFAAAHRLGAKYPFDQDPLAKKQFDHYLLMIHGQPRRYGVNWETTTAMVLFIFMGLFAAFSLLARYVVDGCTSKSRKQNERWEKANPMGGTAIFNGKPRTFN